MLKKALIHLMNETDIHKITVTDIVEYADYNRSTFYRHYKYKEELLEEICKDMINGLISSFRYPYRDKKILNVDELKLSDIRLFDYIKENANFYKTWKNLEGFPGFKQKFIHTMHWLLKDEIVHFPSKSRFTDINVDLFITYRVYGIWGLVISWVKSDFKASSDYMAEQLIHILSYQPLEKYKTR